MTNIEKVQQIYQAFGTGDVPTILGHLSDDVEWEYGVNSTNVPWLQVRRGRDGAAAFFQSLAALEIRHFAVTAICESGSVVIALVNLEATVRATRRPIKEEDEVHLWHFDAAGKVFRFRHRVDSHQHWVAYGNT